MLVPFVGFVCWFRLSVLHVGSVCRFCVLVPFVGFVSLVPFVGFASLVPFVGFACWFRL